MSPSASDSPSQKKILIIKLGALGDFIQALGPMAAIRRHHPDAEITLLTTAPFVSLGIACGYVDHVWTDTRPKWTNIKGLWRLRQQLRQGQFDRVYDLQNNDRTALYLNLMRRTDGPEWVGAAAGASHRNNNPERTAGTSFSGHIQTLALAGIHDVEIDDLHWAKGDITHFINHEKLTAPYVLLVPGSSPQHPEKRWPAENYGHLARIVHEWGYQPVVIGTTDESAMGKEICSIQNDTLDLTGKTSLFDLAILGRHAVAAIGNDTGPMHIIAPTGCPSFVLFSKHSQPHRHAPCGPAVKTLQIDDLKNLSEKKVEELISAVLFKN